MEKVKNFNVLEKIALDLGAIDAKVFSADQIVVEDRVRLKCMVGCPFYGKTLKCPPYTPSTDDFRNILKEYNFAMIIKLKLPEIISESGHYRTLLTILLEIERAAFNQGYTFATVFYAGHCRLCEKCNVENGTCLNPMMSRFSAEAMGINLLKTAKNVGMELKIPTSDNKIPLTPMAILLID